MSNVERMARALSACHHKMVREHSRAASVEEIAAAALACAREIAEEAVSVHPTQGPMPAEVVLRLPHEASERNLDMRDADALAAVVERAAQEAGDGR